MKKIILLIICVLLLIGCDKLENKKEDVINKGDWVIDITSEKETLEDDVLQIFERAKSNFNGKLEYVSLLGKQVVAGVNYMFLCHDDIGYKIAIVYNNLENVSQITHTSDFDPIKYVNENIEGNNLRLAGGWYSEIKEGQLPLEIDNYFNKAIDKLSKRFYPIALMAHENKSGTNYAVLCYSDEEMVGVYMLTLYIDETNQPSIVSIANVDLKEFNR